jgi:hypothetical protein
MNSLPEFLIQLVHTQGPLKGEIQPFTDNSIRIGRNTDYEVTYPPDFLMVSRDHALIERVANSFKITDKSKNGTFLNGLPIEEAELKHGDVITLSKQKDGPKFTFLAEPTGKSIETAAVEEETLIAPPRASPEPPLRPSEQPTTAGLTIQFGPALRMFDTLPISIGQGSACDFSVNDPNLSGPYLRIHFASEDYYAEDAGNMSEALHNGIPLKAMTPLAVDDLLSLTPRGPHLRYLGDGRLMEHTPAPSMDPPPVNDTRQDRDTSPPAGGDEQKEESKKAKFLDSILDRIKKHE